MKKYGQDTFSRSYSGKVSSLFMLFSSVFLLFCLPFLLLVLPLLLQPSYPSPHPCPCPFVLLIILAPPFLPPSVLLSLLISLSSHPCPLHCSFSSRSSSCPSCFHLYSVILLLLFCPLTSIRSRTSTRSSSSCVGPGRSTSSSPRSRARHGPAWRPWPIGRKWPKCGQPTCRSATTSEAGELACAAAAWIFPVGAAPPLPQRLPHAQLPAKPPNRTPTTNTRTTTNNNDHHHHDDNDHHDHDDNDQQRPPSAGARQVPVAPPCSTAVSPTGYATLHLERFLPAISVGPPGVTPRPHRVPMVGRMVQ